MTTTRIVLSWIAGLALPAVLASLDAVAAAPAVAGGFGYSVALGADGRVRTWGNDEKGALGLDRKLWSCPSVVPGASRATAVSAGLSHVLVLRDDRTVRAWGGNGAGQLGDGSYTSSP